MPPPYLLDAAVLAEARRIFSESDAEAVLTALKETSLWAERSGPPPRVHIAVLWTSKGDLRQFRQRLEWACGDWRDVLLEAGLAGDDWREILLKRGIDASNW